MPEPESHDSPSRLESVSVPQAHPTIREVLCFEDLPLGSRGSRRAVVRWSDGTEGEALTWYVDSCGCPHKSSYADARVMPTPRRSDWTVAEKDSAGSA
jgi:hypothetical protein